MNKICKEPRGTMVIKRSDQLQQFCTWVNNKVILLINE